LRRSLRALLDGKEIDQIPWHPPVVARYLKWMVSYVLYGLKIWQIRGFRHTEEWINVYIMFENIKNQAKSKNLKRKVTEKTAASIETSGKGKERQTTYIDKVNMGNPKSDAIDFIRKQKQLEK
jgi:hypothetical protein